MTMLYIEGANGISGDMTVAALLDLGADKNKLAAALQSVPSEFEYTISHKKSYGLDGCDFDVRLILSAHHHTHAHTHRHLKDVFDIIDGADMTDRARLMAKKIFEIVAAAESKAHGCAIEDVHFHEVGAMDSIVDIISAAVLWDSLNIESCIVTGLNEGHGFVECQHGLLPVPVPAVLHIAEAHQIPLRPTDVNGEMVTPTGIAIAAALRTHTDLPPAYTVYKQGIGIGKRDFGRPNCLRLLLINEA